MTNEKAAVLVAKIPLYLACFVGMYLIADFGFKLLIGILLMSVSSEILHYLTDHKPKT